MNHIIKAMQDAVDVVLTSPHPDNKVAATLFNDNNRLSRTNEWPLIISEKLGNDRRIGDSSGTLHAEVNALIQARFATEGASLAITDPCCPNCAKCIAEAGIKKVYIDHKGFEKDFAARRGDEFQDMSLRILAHAGIEIYEVIRKELKTRLLYEPPADFTPPEDNPIEIRPCRAPLSKATLLQTARLVKVKHERWGCALATDAQGKIYTLVASSHPAIGYTQRDIEKTDGKYDFILEPVNRILMGAARHQLKLSLNHLWCSVLPSPREMVNLVGYGIETVYIGNLSVSKKSSSTEARETLEKSEILTFEEMKLGPTAD
jgi:deoxycytidylate deaminase